MACENLQEPLALSVFVDQSSPDIDKYFRKHMPGWQRETLTKILSIATFVFDGRSEEQQKQEGEKLKAERKRERKEREISLLDAAIAQNCSQRGRCQGFPHRGIRGRGQRGRGLPPSVSPYFNTPERFHCGNSGHIQRACPLRPVTSAVEVRNYGEKPPRPHSQ